MPPPGEPTTSYDGTGTFHPAAAAPRGAGSTVESSEEFCALLRRRLSVLTLISLCAISTFAIVLTPFYIAEEVWRYLFSVWFLVVLAAAGTALLRSRRPLSLRSLRAIDLALVGVVSAYLAQDLCHILFQDRFGAVFARLGQETTTMELRPLWFAKEPEYVRYQLEGWMMWALSGWNVLAWVLLLVGYSLFIPNTWKRATLILSSVAAIPIGLHAVLCLTDPELTWYQAGVLMLSTTVIMSFSAAITIFGAHRIESLRREAAAARRLGQYQLRELIGSGGMGEVYRAEHVLLRRPCAIKLIRPERAGDPQNLRRFEREVQAMATLTNWHTVEIYDYGHAADGTFYYVMELLPGLTLEQLVKQYGPLPPARAVHLLRQVCVALREAHGIGLIHRDIKPGNIIVGERGGQPDVAKLLDFGLVRPVGLGVDEERLTQTGAVVGTPSYVSPEQASDSPEADVRSDIYSLGAVAYFLLTGRPPFVGKTALHVLAAHLREDARPLTDLRPDVPADLQAVVLRCLEKEPGKRFADIDSLEEALAGCECAICWNRDQAAEWWRTHGRQAVT